MNVERIDIVTLSKLLSGKVQHPVTCIVKFYSNTCGYCHALEVPYRDIASHFKEVLFFAINSEEVPEHLLNKLGVNGVPSFLAIPRTRPGRQPRPKLLEDPRRPHPTNFYYIDDIKRFIERHAKVTRRTAEKQLRRMLNNEDE
tara:strand:+ start:417 stop:845 length:429 start_codon:yes stop_codon:yes gene_type:complete